METTEKIVEAYVRYVRRWATIPNIKCPKQKEVDLIAIDPVTMQKYHIESGVSISQSYSKLTANPFSPYELKQRVGKARQRRTLGYFLETKFSHKAVVEELARYGFHRNNYIRVIVTWGSTEDARKQANDEGVEIWNFPNLIKEISDEIRSKRSYFTDDTLRTIHLFVKAQQVQSE